MLNGMKEDIMCVRGNCDTEVDQMVLEFPVMADYAIVDIGGQLLYLTHGHVYNCSNLPPLKKGDILFNGHTHVPKCEFVGDVLYMNPGSVSIPKENSEHSYMIVEDGKFEWKNLDGEIYMEYNK